MKNVIQVHLMWSTAWKLCSNFLGLHLHFGCKFIDFLYGQSVGTKFAKTFSGQAQNVFVAFDIWSFSNLR